MRFLTVLLCTVFLCVGPRQVDAASEKLSLGGKMFSAFTCATYAENAGKENEQGRLFELGLASGRTFIEAVRAKEFTEEEMRTGVPLLGVLMLLQGPSVDFMIGRIYENAARKAHDDISSPNAFDEELSKRNAENKFMQANCIYLR